jgi:CcmD family protein
LEQKMLMMFIAYAFVFTVIFVVTLRLRKRQDKLFEELALLKKSLNKSL